MKRIMCLAALAAVFVLAAADTAQAQRRGGWGGGYRGWDGGYRYGGWDGYSGGFNRGYGFGYGYPYSGGYYGGYYPYRNYGYSYGYPTTDFYYVNPPADYGTFDSSSYAQMPSQSGDVQSFYYAPERRDDIATVRVRLPRSDAKVFFEGQPTQQQGTDRLFQSPPLEKGKSYKYDVKATWMENGREVTREKKVDVRPGQMAMVNFGSGQGRSDTEEIAPPSDRRSRDRNRDLDRTRERDRDLDRTKERDRNETDRSREGAARHRAPEGDMPLIEGKITKVQDNQIVVTDKANHQYELRTAKDTQVMVDGKKSDLNSLKTGTEVSITLKHDDPNAAAKIETAAGHEGASKDQFKNESKEQNKDQNREQSKGQSKGQGK
jgi:uncharacterized protein (TIGR03000 family)